MTAMASNLAIDQNTPPHPKTLSPPPEPSPYSAHIPAYDGRMRNERVGGGGSGLLGVASAEVKRKLARRGGLAADDVARNW